MWRISMRSVLLALILSLFPIFTATEQATATADGLNAYWINGAETVTSGTEPFPFSTNTCHTATLTQINQASGSTSPGGTCRATYFSTYITGFIEAPFNGTVNFFSRTDDGFRLVINGQTVISDWESQGMAGPSDSNATGSMTMTAGEVYPIQIYHHQGTGGWGYILDWSYGATSRTTIPTTAFGKTYEALRSTPMQTSTCQIGSSAECPALSAQEIFGLYGTTTNGAYWIRIDGAPTRVFIIFDRSIGNGSWVMSLKGSATTTRFKYSDSHWDTTSTLNSATGTPETLTSTGAGIDAKYPTYNSAVAEQMMAIFPDVGSSKFGGAFSNTSYGFIWRETVSVAGALNATSEAGCPAANSTLLNLFRNSVRCGFRQVSSSYNASEVPYSAIGNGVFSSQVDVRFFGINYDQLVAGGSPSTRKKARWGFGWNENGAGNESSNDLINGIGLEGTSTSVATDIPAGDHIGCCQSATGLAGSGTNPRQMGFQIFYKAPEANLGAPSGLTAVRDTSGVTTLRWSQPASGTPQEYVVQYKPLASAWSASNTLRVISPTSTPSATLTGLAGATNYEYRVFARTYSQPNTYNFSTSAASSSITKLAKPNTPSTTSPSATSISVTYETVSAATSYTARLFNNSGIQVGADRTLFSSPTTISGLTSGATYRVTIQAIGDGTNYSNSDQSETATVTVLAEALAPTISSQPADTTSANSLTTTFLVVASSPDGGALSYQWFESTTASSAYTSIPGATSATYSFAPTSGYQGAKFRVVITNTKNSDTEVVTSNSATLTLDNSPPSLSSAAVLAVGNQIRLTFSETLSATTAATSAFSISDSGTTLTPTSVFISGNILTLTFGQTIKIGSVVLITYNDPSGSNDGNAVQDALGNDVATFTNISVTNNSSVLNTLDTPTTLAASSTETTTATFTFTNTTNASSHTLRIYDSTTSTLLSTTTSFTSGSTRTGLTPATQYYATLQAVGDGVTYESSTASSPLYFTTLIRKPVMTSPPNDTATTTSRSATFTVTATSPDGGTLSYQWQVSSDGGASYSTLSNASGISGVTTTTLTLTSLTTAENSSRYRVIITNTKVGVTSSETSTAATLTVNGAISLSGGSNITKEYFTAASSAAVSASGGTGTISFTISGGTAGISINANTGVVNSDETTPRGTYSLTITATDQTGATATQSITITITQGIPTLSISLSATPRKGTALTFTATTSVAGTVRFLERGRVISGCKSKTATGPAIMSLGSRTATCTWRPRIHGPSTVSAILTPASADYSTTTARQDIVVLKRTASRS